MSLAPIRAAGQYQGDQKIRKIHRQFFQKIAHKVARSKKAKNIYNKAQFERPKHLQQTTFETLKVAQLTKNRPIWSPWSISTFLWREKNVFFTSDRILSM